MIPRPAAPLLTDELKKQPPGMPGGRLVKAASGSHFRGMQHLLLILLHVVRSLGKLLKPDGVKALVAENCLLKHQPLIVCRSKTTRPEPSLLRSPPLRIGFAPPESTSAPSHGHPHKALHLAPLSSGTRTAKTQMALFLRPPAQTRPEGARTGPDPGHH